MYYRDICLEWLKKPWKISIMIVSHRPIIAPRTPRIKTESVIHLRAALTFLSMKQMIYFRTVSRLQIFWNQRGKRNWDRKGKYSCQFPSGRELQTLAEAASKYWNSKVMTETLTEIKVFFVDAESFQTFLHLIAPAVRCRSSINQVSNKTTCTTGWVQINREWFHAYQLVQGWCPLRCNRRLPFTIKKTQMRGNSY
jgi:hypothetical protein